MTTSFLTVHSTRLLELLEQASFQTNGDIYEQAFGNLITAQFPNCERFWKLFIIPFTERMSGYPESLSTNIGARNLQTTELEELSASHYSVFIHLGYAHSHLSNYLSTKEMIADAAKQGHVAINLMPSIENFYVHLGTICDLTEQFLEQCYFILLRCNGEVPFLLKKMQESDFMEMMHEWYDRHYSAAYEYYLSKGRGYPINFPDKRGAYIPEEFVAKYLNSVDTWENYKKFSKAIREFRNIIAHNVFFGRGMASDGEIFIPRPEKASQFKKWHAIKPILQDRDKASEVLVAASQQLDNDLTNLKTILNQLWEPVIQAFSAEFYSSEKNVLRSIYELEFVSSNEERNSSPLFQAHSDGTIGIVTASAVEILNSSPTVLEFTTDISPEDVFPITGSGVASIKHPVVLHGVNMGSAATTINNKSIKKKEE
jgi:hypothetical protein